MSDGLYVTGTEPATGKSAVALGVYELLARRVGRLGVFRPVVEAREGPDPVVDLLRPRAPDPAPYEASIGVSYADLHADEVPRTRQLGDAGGGDRHRGVGPDALDGDDLAGDLDRHQVPPRAAEPRRRWCSCSDRTPMSPRTSASMPCTQAATPWIVVMHGMPLCTAAVRIS